jgi:hypothetical protein
MKKTKIVIAGGGFAALSVPAFRTSATADLETRHLVFVVGYKNEWRLSHQLSSMPRDAKIEKLKRTEDMKGRRASARNFRRFSRCCSAENARLVVTNSLSNSGNRIPT